MWEYNGEPAEVTNHSCQMKPVIDEISLFNALINKYLLFPPNNSNSTLYIHIQLTLDFGLPFPPLLLTWLHKQTSR